MNSSISLRCHPIQRGGFNFQQRPKTSGLSIIEAYKQRTVGESQYGQQLRSGAFKYKQPVIGGKLHKGMLLVQGILFSLHSFDHLTEIFIELLLECAKRGTYEV